MPSTGRARIDRRKEVHDACRHAGLWPLAAGGAQLGRLHHLCAYALNCNISRCQYVYKGGCMLHKVRKNFHQNIVGVASGSCWRMPLSRCVKMLTAQRELLDALADNLSVQGGMHDETVRKARWRSRWSGAGCRRASSANGPDPRSGWWSPVGP